MQKPHLAARYPVATTTKSIRDFETTPALFLDHSEELRMGLSDEQLIGEAVECNHAGIGSTTLHKYEGHLVHFAQYLASAHRSDFYRANKKQVRLFMGHLEKSGGGTRTLPACVASGARLAATRTVRRAPDGRPPIGRATSRHCVSSITTSSPTMNCRTSTRPSSSPRHD